MKARLFSAAVLMIVTSALASAQQFIVAPKLSGAPATYTLEADVNGDRNSDLVLFGYNANSRQTVLTILLGNGAGNFTQTQQITLDNVQPRAIATADWNGDGIPDLALGEIFPNAVAIYLGAGDGTFTAGNQYSLGDFVDGLAGGDLNGDGIADLITSNDLGTLSVLLGQGGGNLGPPMNYSLGNISEAEEVIVADFNRDGKLDVAVALPESTVEGSVAVLLGKGDGSLQTAVQYSTGTSFAFHLVAADFNHDGVLDTATAGTFFLGVLVGNGDGTFQAAKSYATIRDSGPIRVADLNGDGNPDVVAVNMTYQPFAIAVFLGNTDGSFQPSTLFGTSTPPFTLEVADFNGDGIPDAVIPDTSISFLTGQGDGSFYARRVFNVQGLGAQQKFNNASLTSVAAGTVDADSNLDIASLDSESSQVIVLRGKKDGTFGSARRFQSGKSATTIALADFNRDGKTDIVTDNNAGISILIGNGNGNFAKHVEYEGSSAAHFVATGDANGDGKIDVITANDSAKTVTVFLNDGAGRFNTHLDTSMSNEPFLVAVGDFNLDGKLDIVTANRGDVHAATILMGNGDGTFAKGTTYATKHVAGIGVLGLAVADFNLDGKLDFAIGSGLSVYVFPGNGDGTFGNYIQTTNTLSYAMKAGDFNGDSKPDLVVESYGDEVLLVGQGDGKFHVQDAGGVESSFSSAAGDFNHDGALDVVLGGDISNTVTVLLNTGSK